MDKIDSLKQVVIDTLDQNKAQDIISINLKDKSSMADYMIIASGTSSRHIQALSEQVLEKFRSNGLNDSKIEGKESAEWKLVDGIDLIVHIFHPEKRKFYELEKMWSELIPKEKVIIWKKTLFIFLALFFLLISKSLFANESDIYKKIDLFGEVLEKINEEYVEEIDQSKSMDSAINGLLQSLDPYSAYLSPEDFEEMQTETSGEFGGLGIEVSMEAGVVKVITPIDDTPASRAGLKAGDYIVKINDVQVQGKTLAEAVELMRGPVGSDIEITVRRRGVKKAMTFNITREIIQIQSVKTDLIEKNIGYLRLTSFNENSAQQIKKRINELDDNQKLKGYILDLRNNPGGLLSQAIKITDYFLNDGEIVSTKSRKSSENRKWFAKKGDITNGKPLIVLINYGSASASEIVAGALKDHKRAIVLGENSYGKGSVQSIIPLRNNGAVRLTIAKYYLPSGSSISEVGVTPDIQIDEESEDFKIKTESDNQLNYAIKLLNG